MYYENNYGFWHYLTFTCVFLVVSALGTVMSCNGWNSTMGRYDIVGTVSGPIGSKLAIGTQTGGQTRYSVPLRDLHAPNRPIKFGSSHKAILNCSSTQCAALSVGETVQLSCYPEWNAWEPEEEECRFDRLLDTD